MATSKTDLINNINEFLHDDNKDPRFVPDDMFLDLQSNFQQYNFSTEEKKLVLQFLIDRVLHFKDRTASNQEEGVLSSSVLYGLLSETGMRELFMSTISEEKFEGLKEKLADLDSKQPVRHTLVESFSNLLDRFEGRAHVST